MKDRRFIQALDRIRLDRKHGAAELAGACLEIMAESSSGAPARDIQSLRRILEDRRRKLTEARPSMAPIQRLLDRWFRSLPVDDEVGLKELRAIAETSAQSLIVQSRRARREAAAQAAEFIGPGKTLITHSLSSTVSAVFELLRDSGVEAIITESRPMNEGHRLAQRLSQWGIATRLITDAQIGLAVADADLALVGADSLLADGSLVNKAGTYLLALAARDRGIPFLVCSESFKRRLTEADYPVLESPSPSELDAPDLPGVTPVNTYFDITPRRLISGWIDESGVVEGGD